VIDDPAAAARNVADLLGAAERHTWRRCAELTWVAIDHALAAPRRSMHADDGHLLARVTRETAITRGAAARFDVARGLPAVRRRLDRAWHGRSARA
jgi:hypothetical protein